VDKGDLKVIGLMQLLADRMREGLSADIEADYAYVVPPDTDVLGELGINPAALGTPEPGEDPGFICWINGVAVVMRHGADTIMLVEKSHIPPWDGGDLN
jgi:hypothetical protein